MTGRSQFGEAALPSSERREEHAADGGARVTRGVGKAACVRLRAVIVRNGLVLLLVVGVSVGLALGLSYVARPGIARSGLELAPAGSSVVVHLDVPALLRSPLWEALAGDDEGLARVREACGFDPLARLASAEVFVVGTTRHPLDQIGFVARGDLPRDELVRCVETVVEEDGGGVHTVEIEGEPALASDHGDSRAAFLAPDGVVAGDEVLVRQVLRIEHGTARGASDDEVLARLWSRVSMRDELVAVAHVPASWRRTIEHLSAGFDGLETIRELESVGIGARIARGLGATIVLELETVEGTSALEAGLRTQVEALRADPLVRLSTVGGALRHLDFEATGRALTITADLDEEELEAAVALAREALDRLLAPEVPDAPREPTEPIELPPPDAVIEPSE